MSKSKSAFFLASSLISGACHGSLLYSVTSAPDTAGKAAPAGIPFYALEQWDVTTSSYGERYFELTASATEEVINGGKPVITKLPAVTVYTTSPNVASDYYLKFASAASNEARWNATGHDWAQHTQANPPPSLTYLPPSPKTTAATAMTATFAGSTQSRVQLPSRTLFYLNVAVPHGGSSNAEVDLNADGTLGKAIAQKQDQFPAAAAAAAGAAAAGALGTPLGNVVAHFLPTPAAAGAAAAPFKNEGDKRLATVDLAVVEVRIIYGVKASRRVSSPVGSVPASPCAAIDSVVTAPSDDCRADFTVTVQRGDASAAGPASDTSIRFSGSVVLPTPPPAAPAPAPAPSVGH